MGKRRKLLAIAVLLSLLTLFTLTFSSASSLWKSAVKCYDCLTAHRKIAEITCPKSVEDCGDCEDLYAWNSSLKTTCSRIQIIGESPETIHANVGNRIELKCYFNLEVEHIVWHRNFDNQFQIEGRYQFKTPFEGPKQNWGLVIDDIKESDEGKYWCSTLSTEKTDHVEKSHETHVYVKKAMDSTEHHSDATTPSTPIKPAHFSTDHVLIFLLGVVIGLILYACGNFVKKRYVTPWIERRQTRHPTK
ncbi:hypothetical protein CHUAL_013274 [Chamberlinius hualienensis]